MRGRPFKNVVALEKFTEVVDKYVNQKMGLFELAAQYQVTVPTIKKVLLHCDVTIRPRGPITGTKKTVVVNDVTAPLGE